MLKCIILEDEQAAQDLLSGYIEKVSFLDCIGVFESGMDLSPELVAAADLIFLDIQLPGLDGLSYVKSLDNPPHIIVTSAYTEHALEAFEIAVTDYLLKPFSFKRFLKAVNRVKANETKLPPTDQVHFIYADKTTYKVKSSEILFVKAEVDYVKVVTDKQEILVLDSLRNWTQKLNKQGFIQIHRSYLVRLEAVLSVSASEVMLASHQLPVGASFKKALLAEFNRGTTN